MCTINGIEVAGRAVCAVLLLVVLLMSFSSVNEAKKLTEATEDNCEGTVILYGRLVLFCCNISLGCAIIVLFFTTARRKRGLRGDNLLQHKRPPDSGLSGV